MGPIGSYDVTGSGSWPAGTSFRLDVSGGRSGGYVGWLWGQGKLVASGDVKYDPAAKLSVEGVSVTGPFVLGGYGFALGPDGRVSGPVSAASGGPGGCKQNAGQPISYLGQSGPDTTVPSFTARGVGPIQDVTLPWDRFEIVASEGLKATAFAAAVKVSAGGTALPVTADEITQEQTGKLLITGPWFEIVGRSIAVTIAPGLVDPSGNASLAASLDVPVAAVGAAAKSQSALDAAGPHPGFSTKSGCGAEASCLGGSRGAKLALLVDAAGATTLRVRYRVPTFGSILGQSKGHLVADLVDAAGNRQTVDVATFSATSDWTDAVVPLAAGSGIVGLVLSAGSDPVSLGQCQPSYSLELARISAE